MANEPLLFRVHAIERMAQRNIGIEDVRAVLDGGELIEYYPDDYPYPSALVLGWVKNRPLHVVVANAPTARIIITIYEPDPIRWEPDFKRRKS
jgi:hypothetical protein